MPLDRQTATVLLLAVTRGSSSTNSPDYGVHYSSWSLYGVANKALVCVRLRESRTLKQGIVSQVWDFWQHLTRSLTHCSHGKVYITSAIATQDSTGGCFTSSVTTNIASEYLQHYVRQCTDLESSHYERLPV